ncbi:MAG: helix-turn-helix domain-containing protein, partial [Clostridiales bacterium]|nr:helix-turn-helix domain-containing protein [Clostridiales bacterium]
VVPSVKLLPVILIVAIVKMDLTPELLESALRRAIENVKKERALRAPETGTAPSGLEQYRDRLFIQLYGGLFQDRAYFDDLCSQLGLHFDAPWYAVAVARFTCRKLSTEQLATLSAGVTNMAADVLPKYLPCTVTASNLSHFYVLLPLDSPAGLEQRLDEVLKKVGQILFNYFSTPIHWAVGQPVQDILKVQQSQRTALSILTQVTDDRPVLYYQPQATTPAPRRAQTVAQIQEYICQNLSKPLSLNDVAAVFNFSPNHLSQLFSQNGESSFVEFVTATRINTAKELMATTDLKIYEISERVGFESSSYFSKVFDGSATDSDVQTAGSTLLVTDIAGGESSLFIVEDADGFLELYADQMDTARAATWTDSPILSGLDAGSYSTVEDIDTNLTGQALLAEYTVLPAAGADSDILALLLGE